MKNLSQGAKNAHAILFWGTHLKLVQKIVIWELFIFWPYNSCTPTGTSGEALKNNKVAISRLVWIQS